MLYCRIVETCREALRIAVRPNETSIITTEEVKRLCRDKREEMKEVWGRVLQLGGGKCIG